MSWFYRHLVRPALFTQNPEEIHNFTMRALGFAGRHAVLRGGLRALFGAAPLPVKVFGLNFPNPVGLAAGMDKHAQAVPTWPALGFGFTELGAVTWHAQPGNPRPRVFRIIPDEAIINRMGFNNPGAEATADMLAQWKHLGLWPAHPVGINLGKSKVTALADAPGDYARSFRVLLPWLDFFVVNVSSPNTPNLRQLQERSALAEILSAVQELQPANAPKPLLVKVAPDLSWSALDEIVELVVEKKVAGLVATNTTITRPEKPELKVAPIYAEMGGLSGRPLAARSTEVIRHLYRQTEGKVPIIGSGGIFTAEDAWEKIRAGASLVQIYTGLVYEGPGVASAIVRGLRRILAEHGCRDLADGVGLDGRGPGPLNTKNCVK